MGKFARTMEDILIGNGIRINNRDYEIIGVTGGDHYSLGGPTVFDVFDTAPYQYLKVKRGTVSGNIIESMHSAYGIFKLRGGFTKGQNTEESDQGATLHIRPDESFLSNVPSNREHYTLTLNPADYSDFQETS